MTNSTWTLITNGLLLVTVLGLYLHSRRERRKAIEDAAAVRSRYTVDRAGWQSVGRL